MEFLRKLFQQDYCQLELKGTDRVCNEIRLSFSQNFLGRKEHDKTTQLQTRNTFHEKRNNDSEGGKGSRGTAVNHGGLFPDLET